MNKQTEKIDLKDKLVLVTGASSMIGRAVVKNLLDANASVVSSSHKYCDLMDIYNLRTMYQNTEIDYVINLAGFNGNIQFNRTFPANIYYRTVQIGLNVLKFCQEKKVKKVVSVLSSCAYPDTGDILKECDLWSGQPNFSVESHGFAKRTLAEYSRQLAEQYNICAISTVVNNSYGPFDNFDPRKTKVVGSLIKKFSDAKQNKSNIVTLWGSGAARRSFVFSENVGEGIVRVLENYHDTQLPINIATDEVISIKELAELIAELFGYDGIIDWNFGEDGQMFKTLSTERMRHYLQWEPTTSLRTGLKKTISWYLKNAEGIQQENI